MAGIDNRTVYPLVEVGGEVIIITPDGQTRSAVIVGGPASRLVHHYRANLNKVNNISSNVVPTVFSTAPLPSGVAVTYNFVNNGLSGFRTVIRITGWPKENLFIPQYHNNASAFDDYAKMYRLEEGLGANEVQIVIDFQFEDFQMLTNFPFEIYFYNTPE